MRNKKEKLIRIPYNGFINILGVEGPISRPYLETVDNIFNMMSQGIKVIEVTPEGERVINITNFDKTSDNIKLQFDPHIVELKLGEMYRPVVTNGVTEVGYDFNKIEVIGDIIEKHNLESKLRAIQTGEGVIRIVKDGKVLVQSYNVTISEGTIIATNLYYEDLIIDTNSIMVTKHLGVKEIPILTKTVTGEKIEVMYTDKENGFSIIHLSDNTEYELKIQNTEQVSGALYGNPVLFRTSKITVDTPLALGTDEVFVNRTSIVVDKYLGPDEKLLVRTTGTTDAVGIVDGKTVTNLNEGTAYDIYVTTQKPYDEGLEYSDILTVTTLETPEAITEDEIVVDNDSIFISRVLKENELLVVTNELDDEDTLFEIVSDDQGVTVNLLRAETLYTLYVKLVAPHSNEGEILSDALYVTTTA